MLRLMVKTLPKSVHEEIYSGQCTKPPAPSYFQLSLRSWGHRLAGGLCCGFRPLPTVCSETQPVLCSHVGSAGPGQQCTDAGGHLRVIAKASCAYPVTQPPRSHTFSTINHSVDLAALSWTTVGNITSFQTHTHCIHVYTNTHKCIHAHMHTHTRVHKHTNKHVQTHQ